MHYEAFKQQFKKPLAEGQFPDRGPYLSGEGFGARAKATADSIKALRY